MVDEGDGVAGGGTDGPTATEEINLVVGIDASLQMQGQMEIQQAGVGTRMEYRALFFLSFGAGIVRGQVGRATEGAILACQFAG
jgi:hypothetical protein